MKEYNITKPKEGLTSVEAKRLLKKYGLNKIQRLKKVNPIKIFLSQFTSPLILILIASAIISIIVGYLPGQDPRIIDSTLIIIIVLVSGISGFIQEYKAEKAIEALQKLATPKAKVIRDGDEIEISVTELVPGDIVLLSEGDVIPADIKLTETYNLKVDESSLTGESKEVEKKVNEQAYMDCFVYTGSGKGIVIKTGMRTKIGEIATKLQEIKESKSSFEIEVSKLSKKLFYIIIIIIAIIFTVGIFKYSVYDALLTSISLAVAAIPEGLPAIVVLSLAIGAKVMASKHALIRKLSVAESIGAIDIICTDKTGTLTKNEMTVTRLYTSNEVFKLNSLSKKEINLLKPLIICGSLCNNSVVSKKNDKNYIGDPTEIALRKVAEHFGFAKETLELKYKKLSEISFTSERKMMSVLYKIKGKSIIYSKGAPEIIISKCTNMLVNGKLVKLNKARIKEILNINNRLASDGLRVLGFAYKTSNTLNEKSESGMTFLGLQAMLDPPREEVRAMLKSCNTAKIRVIMMTGDNPITARSIANKIGLHSTGAITGNQLDKINNKELEKKLAQGVNIFARVTAFHKIRILSLLQKKYRVAMTGDGVNDSLALKKADVGIAMNINGTDVSKEASDMILLDDNFASIVIAVKEGRRIFENIRKFINYLLVCNTAEVLVIFFATIIFTLKEPILLPIQILWINLLTDGLPALALGIDPARKLIMQEPPRKKDEPIINKKLAWLIGVIGTKKTILLLITFHIIFLTAGLKEARTALFTGFIIYEFIRIASIRYMDKLSWLSNKWLLASLAGSLLLQFLIIYTPINKYFHITMLSLKSWIIILIGSGIAYILTIWFTKIIIKRVKD